MEIRPSRNILLFNCQGKSGFVKSRDDIHVPTSPANIMLDGNNEPVLVDFASCTYDEGEMLRLKRGPEDWAGQSIHGIQVV